jgi:hypothetical protein
MNHARSPATAWLLAWATLLAEEVFCEQESKNLERSFATAMRSVGLFRVPEYFMFLRAGVTKFFAGDSFRAHN